MMQPKHINHVRAVLVGMALCLSWSAGAAETYRWVQHVPGGLEARAISENGVCPAALVDGAAVAMRLRSTPGEQYPITVCALPLPSGTQRLQIGDTAMVLPRTSPQRILVIGDTGCRLKGKRVQACNDPVAWPFRAGAAHVAQLKPDLIVHVGDFHYRESPCPEGNSGCAGTPYGDTWAVWKEDFFSPVGKLLATAPWVLVRGNHEECDRGGRGWARTLDPYAWSADSGCLPPAEPYLVDIGGVAIAVVDVSTADEDSANEQQAARYRQQYAKVAGDANKPVWIAQHRPIWALETTTPKPAGDNKTLAAAAVDGFAANVAALLSGHHHVLEVLTYERDLPPQLISGHGGDDLSTGVPVKSDGMLINGVPVKRGIAKAGSFGYSLLERANTAENAPWIFSGFDYQGKLLLKCTLRGREAVCD